MRLLAGTDAGSVPGAEGGDEGGAVGAVWVERGLGGRLGL